MFAIITVEETLSMPRRRQILRTVHASNATRYIKYARGNFARSQVVFILTGCRHEHIGRLHSRIFLNGSRAAITTDNQARTIDGFRQATRLSIAFFNQGNLVVFAQKGTCKICAELAAANDNDVHRNPPLILCVLCDSGKHRMRNHGEHRISVIQNARR